MKTLKSLVTSDQPSQIQGVNRTHWGISFKVASQKKGGNRMSYKERQPQVLLYSEWKYREIMQKMSQNLVFNLTKKEKVM